MFTDAERQRRRRERQRLGQIVLPIPLDEVDVTEAMIALKLLHPSDEDNREALIAAVAEHMRRLSAKT